jgi:hypothetical protein
VGDLIHKTLNGPVSPARADGSQIASVIRPVMDAFVDWAWSAEKHEKGKNTTSTTRLRIFYASGAGGEGDFEGTARALA